MITRAEVIERLSTVDDPELGIDIVSLGMVGEVRVGEGDVHVTLKHSFVGCMAVPYIDRDVEAALAGLEANVIVSREGQWSSRDVSPRGAEKLASLGIAVDHVDGAAFTCPFCGSEDVELDSPIGAAPCRAAYACRSCATPFDVMRSPEARLQRLPLLGQSSGRS